MSEKPIVRPLQLTVPQDVEILLQKIILKRTEAGTRPTDRSKSAIVAEAIRKLAQGEGLV